MSLNKSIRSKKLLPLFILMLMSLTTLNSYAQDKILVPYRVGNLFGLSDVSGKLVLSPRYTSISPIGKNVFEFASLSNSKSGLNQEPKILKGVLLGNKEIITGSEHNHFTYLDEGIIVGTESAYTSNNSNFYNLKGERLLKENVRGFRMVVSPAAKAHKGSIAILAKLQDGKVSILIYDARKQIMLAPLLDHVSNFNMERNYSNQESVMICTYTDKKGNYAHDIIYYDAKSGEHKRKPYINEQSAQITEPDEVGSIDVSGDEFVPSVDGDNSSIEQMPSADKLKENTIPANFRPVNEKAFLYGDNMVELAVGERVFFAEPYTHQFQKEPLIFLKDKKYGLYFSEYKRSNEIYDSLIYLRNQYIDFDNPIASRYMAGIKDASTGKWRFGLLNERGIQIVPIIFDYIGFDFDELGYESNDEGKGGEFTFKKQTIYKVDQNLCLKTYHQGIFVVKKDGKFGLINKQNIILLQIEYDQIWKNEINFMEKYSLNDKLYGYRKGNSYGVFFLDRKIGIVKNTGLVFPMLAVSVYEDYMEQKGLDIYNLADPSDINFCSASNKGVIYFKEK